MTVRLIQAIAAALVIAIATAAALDTAAEMALLQHPRSPLGSLSIVAIAATLLAHAMTRLDISPTTARRASVAGGLLAAFLLPRYCGQDAVHAVSDVVPAVAMPSWPGILLGIPHDGGTAIAIAAAALVVWRTGVRFGSMEHVRPSETRRAVAMAIGVLAAIASVAALWNLPGGPMLAPYWLATLVAVPAALALAEIGDVDASGGLARHRAWSMHLAAAIVAIAALAGLALAVASGLSSPLLQAGREGAAWLFAALTRVLVVAAYIVLTPFSWLIEWLRTRMSDVPPKPPGPPEDPLEAWRRQLESGAPAAEHPWIQHGIEIGLAIVVVWLAMRWLRGALDRRSTGDVEEEGVRESDFGARRLTDDARKAARLLAGRIADALGLGRHPATGARRLYTDLLRLMADRGHGRRAEQTPTEFLPMAQGELPAAIADIADLTQAYLEARYGERDVEGGRMAGLTAAWERVRAAGRRS